ncbi:MAG: tRNA (guanosine(37)-N1)-methyltransferase TrmD [Frankiaceae bacterium]|nr:tRNA (guanosine(37)-N1)-methyltransferase TrmD [Frankiaceae bacterium]MBV9869412.1 tRNA (guanosine(37)-N1)-methyltransferase TrmD [Frankiaceae bacterium]
MRIDVITIFPDYFGPLDVSLLGKARERGLLDIRLHDLRDQTDDVHRTVDDAPYGGGPGMLMRPEPWGRALDAVAAEPPAGLADPPLLVIPTPSGRRFAQADARAWSAEPWLVLACGRYEGIDARVAADAATRMRVEEVSIGDYVLAGGEAAALVVIEAVARLLPGFMGNAASAVDDSFTDADHLEAPAYTRPAVWRGLPVPEVLTSGDHAAVARWRQQESARRTRERRPDLL